MTTRAPEVSTFHHTAPPAPHGSPPSPAAEASEIFPPLMLPPGKHPLSVLVDRVMHMGEQWRQQRPVDRVYVGQTMNLLIELVAIRASENLGRYAQVRRQQAAEAARAAREAEDLSRAAEDFGEANNFLSGNGGGSHA